jgi:hypothetical protein
MRRNAMIRVFEKFVASIGFLGISLMMRAQTAPSTAIEALSTPAHGAVEPATSTPDIALDPASLLPDLPALPAAKATLVGGTIEKLDRVQDRITVQVFGGGKASALFDGRTKVYRDGQPASLASLRMGDRVYVDTILYDGTVFARSIRLKTGANQGESEGLILSYRPGKDELIVRDVTAPEPVKLHLTPATRIVNGDRASSLNELAEGTLVSLRFGAEQDGRNTVQQISILALPGEGFTFSGTITFLDLHNGILVLTSFTNHKTYEIHLDPSVRIDANLREGADVTAQTQFDHDRYVARSLTVSSPEK